MLKFIELFKRFAAHSLGWRIGRYQLRELLFQIKKFLFQRIQNLVGHFRLVQNMIKIPMAVYNFAEFLYSFFSFMFCVHLNEFIFFSSRRRHTRLVSDWSSDVCSSD